MPEIDFDAVVARHPDHGADLLRAIRAIGFDDFGTAAESFAAALASDHPELLSLYQGFVLLFLRETAERAYGDRLLAFLTERGLADRHWPLCVAYDAYLHGEARLMDVNPEVRGAARQVYEWLDAPRAAERRDGAPAGGGAARPSPGRGRARGLR
jgi:hypothetical protein